MTSDLRRLLRLFADVGGDLARAPARWRVRQWSGVLVVALACVLACADERPLQSFVERGDGGVERALASFANLCGSGLALVDTAVVLGAAGAWCWILMWLGMHFVWNVALGFAIGSFVGVLATRRWRDGPRRV